MVEKIKKLEFLDFLANKECEITIYSDEISEDGDFNKVLSVTKPCIYQEKTEKRLEPNGKEIILNGIILIKGDLSKNIKDELQSKKINLYHFFNIYDII